MATSYGEIEINFNDKFSHSDFDRIMDKEEDILIVSLPAKSMAVSSGKHPILSKMLVSPYKVVRSRANGSLVLGCMGFTY